MRPQPDAALASLAEVLQRHLGEERDERGPTAKERVAAFLDAPPRELAVVQAEVAATHEPSLAHALEALVDAHDAATLHGASPYEEAPARRRLDLGDEDRFVPADCVATWPSGTLHPDVPLAAVKTAVASPATEPSALLRVIGPPGARQAAEEGLGRLRAHAEGPSNLLRGRVLRARDERGLTLAPVPRPTATRADLVLPDAVWQAVDRGVGNVFARRGALEAAGVPASRGLLLQGPPGTGKTTLSRVLAAEAAGEATVVLADAPSAVRRLGELQRELDILAPMLLIIEDLELLTGGRSGRGERGGALPTLLAGLDALHRSAQGGVVTVVTADEPDRVDPSLPRAGRIDEVLTLAPPDLEDRTRILQRLLEPLDLAEPALVSQLAHHTTGSTGAELVGLCRGAILAAEGPPTREDLLAAVRSDEGPANLGTYL